MVVTRFAPAPSGDVHLGNVRTALLNFLFARRFGGQFMLRIDDTDVKRCQEACVEAIQEDLRWLGLYWDGFMRQTESSYTDVVETLKASGRLYPCYETPEELQAQREERRAAGLPPVYQRKDVAAEGRVPHFRFALQKEEVAWNDLARGPSGYHMRHLSDPVLVREDGTVSYMLSSVADDIRLGVTHIIRGEDHVTNTAVQIQLFEALGALVPFFAHIPLLLDATGQKLSKRLQAVSLRELHEQGVLPMAVVGTLVSVGSGVPPPLDKTLQEIARDFSLDMYGRAAPCLDTEQLFQATRSIVQSMDYETLRAHVQEPWPSKALWEVIRGNIASLEEIPFWKEVCEGVIDTQCVDHDLLSVALQHLPALPWDKDSWAQWTKALQAVTHRKGRALYHPLRLALTGREDGPQMKELFPLINPQKVKERLSVC